MWARCSTETLRFGKIRDVYTDEDDVLLVASDQ
jgi:glucose/arabinose dehydrogenase